MKYLRLHCAIWLIIVLTGVAIEACIFFIIYILYIAWNFSLPKTNIWKKAHSSAHAFGDYDFQDSNFIHTIIRRYKYTFDSPYYPVIDGKIAKNKKDIEKFYNWCENEL